MNTESAVPEFELSINSFSYEALQTAKWADLERFTIEILKRYYEPFGLSIRRTEKRINVDIGGDGAHDGEATIVLGGYPLPYQTRIEGGLGGHPELGILVTLWVEVKKRSRDNVDHHDLGGTIFRSSLEHVTKLVFVSNRGFARQFQEDLSRYATQRGVQFALIDGKTLIRIAEEVAQQKAPRSSPVPDNESQSDVDVHLRFVQDQIYRHSSDSAANIERAVGEPIFVEAKCKVTGLTTLHTGIRLNLCYQGSEILSIRSRLGNNHHAVGIGDQLRSVFTVFASRAGVLSLEHFSVEITDDKDRAVQCSISHGNELCYIRGTLLPNWIPPSKAGLHRDFSDALQEWISGEQSRSVNVISIAGAGKTHLVRSMRQLWLSQDVHEIYLDGASDQNPQATALAIFAQVFPVPVDAVTSKIAETLVEWLKRSGLPNQEAGILADYIAGRYSREIPFSHTQLGHFLAYILAKLSENTPIVVIFEDLHKCVPTVMTMLQGMQQSLARLGRTKVFILLTSREDSVWDDEAVRTEWRESFGQMRVGTDAREFHLHGFSHEEAVTLIRIAIPEIEEHHAEQIIKQVGTTPFGIREGLGLLVELKAVKQRDQNGTWQLVDPERMVRTLDGQQLRRPTHYRLKGLQERCPSWLSDFLASGACIGASFDLKICAHNAGDPNENDLEKALGECRFLEILRFSAISPSDLQFDHDLVRHVLLEDMGHFKQRRVAKSLFERMTQQAGAGLLSSLAFQAGMAEACWTQVIKQLEAARKAQRHLEAVHALGLALAVTDHNVAANVFAVKRGRYRPSFDEAIAVASPCIRAFDNPQLRDRETADLLLQYVEHLVAVGSGGSPSIAKALTEATMFAERLGDDCLRATLTMYHGRQEFNQENISESILLHQAAEALFAKLPKDEILIKRRSLNLLRLAIAQRQAGHLGESRITLIRAAWLGRKTRAFLAQVRANFGATFFYTDWQKTRHHWTRALRIAVMSGITDRYVHSFIDLAYLDLLEDKVDSAVLALEQALTLSRNQGLENSELRCLLNLSCTLIMRNEPHGALHLLREADRLGFKHEIGRRLWRVRANMATAYFLVGEIERSLAADQMTIQAFPSLERQVVLADKNQPSAGTRIVLALANIALRAADSPKHQKLLSTLPQAAQESARKLATAVIKDRLETLSGLRGRHCKRMGAHAFFVITE
jgi:tetratricopeptide (TPR) repeat protein